MSFLSLKMKSTKAIIILFLILSAVIMLFAYLKMSGIFFNFYIFAALLLVQFVTFVLLVKTVISKHL